MFRRWLLITALTVIACIGAAVSWSVLQSRPALVPLKQPGPLVVVSVPALTYADTPDTRGSALWKLARRGAVGALATRNLSGHSCSLQAWLTVSAGARTSVGTVVEQTPAGQTPAACPDDPTPVVVESTAVFPEWALWRRITLKRAQPADIGRLGSLLPQHGQCISAAGPLAGLGAADHDGVVTHYVSDPRRVDLAACPVTFISLAGPDDAYLRWITARLPPSATIVVAGLADDTGPETLHAVVIAGPGVQHGLLSSGSTGQRGVVTTADLSAFVLSRLGAKAPVLPEGRSPLVQPSSSPTAAVVRSAEITRALNVEHDLVPLFLTVFFALVLAGWALGAVAWWRVRAHDPTSRGRRAVRGWLALVSAVAAAMPVSTFLVGVLPWWRGDQPRLNLATAVVGLSVVLGVLALVGPWRRFAGGCAAFLCLFTTAVIGLDVAHGSGLQFLSMLGLQPVYGSRYSGMGNVAFALFATASLALAAIVASPLTRGRGGVSRLSALTVVLIGMVVVLLDGYPRWGADGGGPGALIPAFAYLALSALGLRLTAIRAIVVVLGTAVVVTALAVLDYLRGPENRTHLGDFVGGLNDGRVIASLNRIWQANWTFLTSSSLTALALVPLLLLLVMALLPRSRWPQRIQSVVVAIPLLAPGLRAVALVWLLGFLLNDSGTAVPPGGMMLLAPLLVLVAARVSPAAPPDPPGRNQTRQPRDGASMGSRAAH
ncbi:MAG: hypothetical protein ABI692_00840 [Terracoccus sp.]